MSICQRLLIAITPLFFSNALLAGEDAGYLALTNAGYVDVTVSVATRSTVEHDPADVYQDQLIIDDVTRMEDESDASYRAGEDK